MNSKVDISSCSIEVDEVTRSQWKQIVDSFSDANLYQTWDYEAVHSVEQRISRLLLKQGDEIIGAAQLRIVQVPFLRAGIAYIYFGPMWRRRDRETDLGVLRALLTALREEYAVKRKLLLRIAINIREGRQPEAAGILLEEGFKRALRFRPYRTFDIDLNPTLEDLRKELHRRWRNHLNKAEKAELVVEAGTDSDLFAQFHQIYNDLHARKGFTEHISVDDFSKIQEQLPETQKMRVLIARHNGDACSGIVLATVGDTGVYLLGATNESGMKMGSSYVLQWKALQWLKENGFQYYDLGGANPDANESVYHFKEGLAGKNPENANALGVWETSASPLSPAVVRLGEAIRKLTKS